MAARRPWRDGAGRGLVVLLFVLLSLTRTASGADERSQPAREAMISDIRATADAVGSIAGRRGFAPETLRWGRMIRSTRRGTFWFLSLQGAGEGAHHKEEQKRR